MSNDNSIYANVGRTTVDTGGPKVQRILRRRIVPLPGSVPWLYEVTVIEGTRLDLIAAKELGDPFLAWRIYDANNAMNPWELLEPPGRQLRIPATQFGTDATPEAPVDDEGAVE